MAKKGVDAIEVFAPAKVNLFLHVTGKRDDGYHTLQSLVTFADFGDTIAVTPADSFSFQVHHDPALKITLESDADNIVIQTAQRLAAYLDKPLNLRLTLHKNIPIGAGLGGGSADAAATIKALLQYWKSTIPVDDLEGLMVKIGADVPMCHHAKPALVQGIGEEITPVEIPDTIPALLIHPHKPCSTQKIFTSSAFDITSQINVPTNFRNKSALFDFLQSTKNDLTMAASKEVPDIQTILNVLAKQDGCFLSRMSGSGSACFGLFDTGQQRDAAFIKIQNEKSEWWVKPVSLASN